MSDRIKVRCIETGEVFSSMTEAGRSIGQYYPPGPNSHGEASHAHISKAVRGVNARTAGGYHWAVVGDPTPSLKRAEDKLPKIYKHLKRKAPKQPKIDYPPEGYVYIFRNRWHPENVYKIGSTDNLEGRRSAARTWGPYKCEYYLEVDDCKRVESEVHDRLSSYRVVSDDLGKEHFTIDLKVAIKTIELANSHESLRQILDVALAA